MKNWWVSWYHMKRYGAFELHFPWWVSGFAPYGATTICAAIKAESEQEAEKIIYGCYDNQPKSRKISFRFCSEKPADWAPFSDRFQKADWMQWDNPELLEVGA